MLFHILHIFYKEFALMEYARLRILYKMPSRFKQDLSSIDCYHALQPKEGTFCGGISSIIIIILLLTLSIASVIDFRTPQTSDDLIPKFNHVSGLIKVHIDIQFPRFPCSILSFNHVNSFEVKETSFRNIEKLILPDMKPYIPSLIHEETLQSVANSILNGKGCRMRGFFFDIKDPWAFQICIQWNIQHRSRPYRKKSHINASHKINVLRFGDQEFTDQATKTLNGYHSEKEANDTYFGTTYAYCLNIVEKNQINQESGQKTEKYLYTSRINEANLAQLPMVYFKYSTSSVSAIEIRSGKTWHSLFVNLVGIIGGLYTAAIIVYRFIYSSAKYLFNRYIIKPQKSSITIISNEDQVGKKEIQMLEKNELRELEETEEKIITPISQQL